MCDMFYVDYCVLFEETNFKLRILLLVNVYLSSLEELLKWYRNSIYSFSISLFVLEIFRFVWYVNNALYTCTSHCIMSCWEIVYMIEIILLKQSKLSLLGVIRQIAPHMHGFVWLCLITSTIFLILQQIIMQYDVCKVFACILNKP